MTFLQKKTMTPCQSKTIIFPSTLANLFCIKLANKLCANMTVYWFGGIERIKTGSQYWEKRIAWGAAKSNGIRFAIWPPCTWIESRSGPAWISLFQSRSSGLSVCTCLRSISLRTSHRCTREFLDGGVGFGLSLGESQSRPDFSRCRCQLVDKTDRYTWLLYDYIKRVVLNT